MTKQVQKMERNFRVTIWKKENQICAIGTQNYNLWLCVCRNTKICFSGHCVCVTRCR